MRRKLNILTTALDQAWPSPAGSLEYITILNAEEKKTPVSAIKVL
jgi:hypothetical protein